MAQVYRKCTATRPFVHPKLVNGFAAAAVLLYRTLACPRARFHCRWSPCTSASISALYRIHATIVPQVESLRKRFSGIHVTIVQQPAAVMAATLMQTAMTTNAATTVRGGARGTDTAVAPPHGSMPPPLSAAAATHTPDGSSGGAGGAPRGGGSRRLDAHMLSLTESVATGTVTVSAISAAAAAVNGGNGGGAKASVHAHKASPLARKVRACFPPSATATLCHSPLIDVCLSV